MYISSDPHMIHWTSNAIIAARIRTPSALYCVLCAKIKEQEWLAYLYQRHSRSHDLKAFHAFSMSCNSLPSTAQIAVGSVPLHTLCSCHFDKELCQSLPASAPNAPILDTVVDQEPANKANTSCQVDMDDMGQDLTKTSTSSRILWNHLPSFSWGAGVR